VLVLVEFFPTASALNVYSLACKSPMKFYIQRSRARFRGALDGFKKFDLAQKKSQTLRNLLGHALTMGLLQFVRRGVDHGTQGLQIATL
jgi:hypothetical protein